MDTATILRTPEFQAMLHRAWLAPLKRSDFNAMPLPAGTDADDVVILADDVAFA